MTEDIPPKKARQGRNSKRILIVLIASLFAAFVVWGIAELYFMFALDPQTENMITEPS